MAKFSGENHDKRRTSTVKRHDEVHEAYDEVIRELGAMVRAVSKAYIYERIKQRTGLCVKTIAYVLNHTERKGI